MYLPLPYFFCPSTLTGIFTPSYPVCSFNNLSIRNRRLSFWFISSSSFNSFYRTVFITVSAVKTMILPNYKRLTFFNTPLRANLLTGSTANTAFCYKISFSFSLTSPKRYVSRKIGFTPRLKYPISAVSMQKMIPMLLVSPGYTFAR